LNLGEDMKSMIPPVRFAALACGAMLGLATAPRAHAADCAGLASLQLPHVTLTAAVPVAAGTFTMPPVAALPPADFSHLPAFCRVQGTARPTPDSDIRFEVWLPLANWNGKYVGGGNGIWAGAINYADMVAPLAAGYATATTDMGHQGNALDAAFLMGHPEKLVDFGHRAVHETTVAAKAIVTAYYGTRARRALYASCSTGGRVGLMEAYRYPRDFDAISAMAPGNSMVDLAAGTLWTAQLALTAPGGRIPGAKFLKVYQAVVAACDADDGVRDGIVSAPQRCGFDPAAMQCKAGDAPDCLTAPQVAAFRGMYEGARHPRTGKPIVPGFPRGSEGTMWLIAGGPLYSWVPSFLRSVVFQDPDWDPASFDYDRDLERARQAAGGQLDIPPAGARAFLARGGKLLLSHGTADGLIPPGNTVNFHEALQASVGKGRANERLFLVPGMSHCAGGAGPHVFDVLSVLDQWVETNKAPERIIASNPPGATPRTRPLCPYPREAQYRGEGSTDEAASFRCAMPVARAAEPIPAAGTPEYMAMVRRQLPLEGAPLAVAGPHQVVTEPGFGHSRVEVRRPADLSGFPSRDRLPVVVWGNGGCALNAGPAAGFLSTLSSHGFLVVTTAGAEGSAERATAPDLKAALDWAFAENARSGSTLRGKIDLEHVAMMGTSCGGYITLPNAADPRIDTIALWSSAAGPGPGLPARNTMPPMAVLETLHGPTLYIDGGEVDFLKPYVEANFAAIRHVPVFHGSRNNGGHSGTFLHAGGGEYANVAVAWLKWQLKGDAGAGRTFTGTDCGLCTNPDWVVERHGAPFLLPATATSMDMSGEWQGSNTAPGKPLVQRLNFDIVDGQLRGTLRNKLADDSVGPPNALSNLKLGGPQLSFSVEMTSPEGGHPIPAEWRGTVVANEIRFRAAVVLPDGRTDAYSMDVERSAAFPAAPAEN
jgi:hypothetical protein